MTNIIYRYLPEKGPRAPYVVGVPARDITDIDLLDDPDMEAIIVANMATAGAIYAIAAPKVTKVAKVAKAATVDVVEDVDG
jgi:hypothetical protein